MKPSMPSVCMALTLALTAGTGAAAEKWDTTPSPAGHGEIPLYIHDVADAVATVVLVPGGPFTIGDKDPQSGKPTGINFLVRTTDRFAAARLHVVLMGKPSQAGDLRSRPNRQSEGHARDVLQAVRYAQTLQKPVWLVGTSLGAISVANAALRDGQGSVAGLVLSSSVFQSKGGHGVLSMDYSGLNIPVLISHHQKDACPDTSPTLVQDLAAKFKPQQVEVSMIDSGHSPKDNPCGPKHWHGYIHAEDEAVRSIAAFIHQRSKSTP